MVGSKNVIQMDELFDDACAKSLAESLIQMYSINVKYTENSIQSFVRKYLPEKADYFIAIQQDLKDNRYTYTSYNILRNESFYNKIIQKIKTFGDIEKCLEEIDEAHEMKSTLKGEFNAGIHNLCGLLIMIDESDIIDDDIFLNKSYGNQEKAVYESIDKLGLLVTIMHGTAEFTMRMDYKKYGTLNGCFYNVSANYVSRIKNIRAFQEIRSSLPELPSKNDGNYCYQLEIRETIDLFFIRKQLALQKLLIALHFLRCSP